MKEQTSLPRKARHSGVQAGESPCRRSLDAHAQSPDTCQSAGIYDLDIAMSDVLISIHWCKYTTLAAVAGMP